MKSKRKHIRLRNYDYSSPGWYFVTICTSNRFYYLGTIKNKTWFPSDIGNQAETFWNEIPEHFPNVELREHVIMPNHIHGILGITQMQDAGTGVGTRHGVSLLDNTTEVNVGTGHGLSLQTLSHTNMPLQRNEFGKTIPGSLSTIIGQFKSSLTRWCVANKHSFEWQGKFYDHIIRNDTEMQNIKEYILNNVRNWENDKFYLG